MYKYSTILQQNSELVASADLVLGNTTINYLILLEN